MKAHLRKTPIRFSRANTQGTGLTNAQIMFVTTQFNVPTPSLSSEIISKWVVRF